MVDKNGSSHVDQTTAGQFSAARNIIDPTLEKSPDDVDRSRHRSSSEVSEQEFVPPNGGFQAWMLVLAGFMVFSNSW